MYTKALALKCRCFLKKINKSICNLKKITYTNYSDNL